MSEILLKKTLTGLMPLDALAFDYCDKLKLGDVIKCKVSKPRNYKHLQKYWVMINVVFQEQSVFPAPEVLHGALKKALGYSTTYKLHDGSYYTHVGSISFAKMTQDQFDLFYKNAVNFVCKSVIPGLDDKDLERELLSF